MESPLKFGVVGVGTVSLRGLIPHLVESDIQDRVKLIALCDPVVDRVEAAAHDFGVPQAYTSYDEFLASSGVDAITIATPIGLHYEQGKAALLAGKHVHFNKTMTVTTSEASELIRLANERQLRIVSSPGEMLRPHNQAVRRMIGDGVIGDVVWAIGAPRLAPITKMSRSGAPDQGAPRSTRLGISESLEAVPSSI